MKATCHVVQQQFSNPGAQSKLTKLTLYVVVKSLYLNAPFKQKKETDVMAIGLHHMCSSTRILRVSCHLTDGAPPSHSRPLLSSTSAAALPAPTLAAASLLTAALRHAMLDPGPVAMTFAKVVAASLQN